MDEVNSLALFRPANEVSSKRFGKWFAIPTAEEINRILFDSFSLFTWLL